MSDPDPANVLEKLGQLRVELAELAFTLEQRHQLEAADVALTTSARVGEICEELTTVPR